MALPDAGADDRKLFVGFREIPYVFILFDNSGSMAWTTQCSQEDMDAGFCDFLCDRTGGGCMTPLGADDPASKLFQAKDVLHQVLLETENVDFGFATFNQDDLRVRSRHWLYEATGNGPVLPSSNPSTSYPAAGQQDVFGRTWDCTSGDSDNTIGCVASNAAILSDPIEAQRVQRWPKGGADWDQAREFFVRAGSTNFRIEYGVPSGSPGDATIDVDVTAWRCQGGGCVLDETTVTVTFALVDDFLYFDLNDPGTGQDVEQRDLITYFSNLDSSDMPADPGILSDGVGQCGGLDLNDDTDEDIFEEDYNLRWPTTADPLSPFLDLGDFVPLDWRDGHKQLILSRMAPNVLLGEGVPDFSISRYFETTGTGPNEPGTTIPTLDLLNPDVRPILPMSKTPLQDAVLDFREWYQGCEHSPNCTDEDSAWAAFAAQNDPNWGCRKKYLLIITDGDESCVGGTGACMATSNMNQHVGVETFVIGYGVSPQGQAPGGMLTCLPANSGAGDGNQIGALFPKNRQELLDALKLIFS
ncbi:MAG: hypothetical protein ACRD0X_01985, partial [Thermoanaerobaculia bacterium]